MDFSEGSSSEILGRLSTAYGVETQKQLAEKLGVSAANVSNWVQRNSVPGAAFVRCALDTGCNLGWLATGVVSNANNCNSLKKMDSLQETGKRLIDKMLSTGGKSVLNRIMEAYKFKTQKELSEYFGISTGTISTWVRRDFFPSEIVIACALDTGVSLQWLSTGDNPEDTNTNTNIDTSSISIPSKSLKSGILYDTSDMVFDRNFITSDLIKPAYIESKTVSWIIDLGSKDISNGLWLLEINSKFDVYRVLLLPGAKINVACNNNEFKCAIDEVNIIGKVCKTILFNE